MRTFTPKPRAGLWIAPLHSLKKPKQAAVTRSRLSPSLGHSSSFLPNSSVLPFLVLVSLLLVSPSIAVLALGDLVLASVLVQWFVPNTSVSTLVFLFFLYLIPSVAGAGSASRGSAKAADVDTCILVSASIAGSSYAAYLKRKRESTVGFPTKDSIPSDEVPAKKSKRESNNDQHVSLKEPVLPDNDSRDAEQQHS